MLDKVEVVYKKKGQTPLDCIKILKNQDKKWQNIPMTYAGRLDPLAEGVLLILIGDECKKKDEYLNKTKEYEVDILFGFSTDTYDLMGLITNKVDSSSYKFLNPRGSSLFRNLLKENARPDYKNLYDDLVIKIQNTLPQFTGRIKQVYPPYSSRRVDGKPLFIWARENKLDTIKIPDRDVFVESIEVLGESSISNVNLLEKIRYDISLVSGDFRQLEIIDLWSEVLKDKVLDEFKVIRLKIICGSGVYVRSIVNDIGNMIDIPAIALNIIRTKVGEYEIKL